mmetsp:Transcript_33373/g.75398  ORF Transcript_33373/g.75398 Transcript_33373/m.75398 type:complete len:161 (-) Transcript_33373:1499-1981(-)
MQAKQTHCVGSSGSLVQSRSRTNRTMVSATLRSATMSDPSAMLPKLGPSARWRADRTTPASLIEGNFLFFFLFFFFLVLLLIAATFSLPGCPVADAAEPFVLGHLVEAGAAEVGLPLAALADQNRLARTHGGLLAHLARVLGGVWAGLPVVALVAVGGIT